MAEPRPLPPQPVHLDHIGHYSQQQQGGLTCQWNNCLKVFPNHPSLASHLSEDHVGWKKGGYYCDWSHCPRQGTKCHNRFALMMHLRIHTGEKPFECTVPNCGQTFGRMDALARHKKAEHGGSSIISFSSDDNTMSIIQTPIPSSSSSLIHYNVPSLTTTTTTTTSNKRMKKTISSQELLNSKPSTTTTTTNYKRPKLNHQVVVAPSPPLLPPLPHRITTKNSDEIIMQQQESTSTKTTTSRLTIGSPDYIQYRLAKAQLAYILRENEMLQDEYDSVQKKLKRMKTERRVLLDALMRRSTGDDLQYDQEEEVVVVEEETEVEENKILYQ